MQADDVKDRLESLGYSVTDADEFAIMFVIKKIENMIMAECNTSEVPAGLEQVAIDMVCGTFLQAKVSTGKLDSSSINVESAIKTIKEGDTSITYAVADSGGNLSFDGLINYLLNYGKPQFAAFRRFVW